MNFFLKHIQYDNRKAYFDDFILLYKSSSNSPTVQVLCQQIRGWGGWGVKACADTADAGGGGGVQNLGKVADVILECSLIY